MTDTPPPGIYENVPFNEYSGWQAVSNTALSRAERSMQHYHQRTVWDEPTPAMRLGSLIHCGKLEPLAMMERYVVMPPFERTVRRPGGGEYQNPKASAAYKAEVAEFERQNSGREIVLQSEFDRLIGAVQALSSNAQAKRYLEGDGPTEVSFIWRDPLTGVLCKGRADKLNMKEGVVADLKTTENASDFEWTIKKRRYHRQAAFYVDGIAVLTGVQLGFALVVAETESPFLVRASRMSERTLRAGRLNYQFFLQQIAECQQSGVWPGYSDPDEWDLPEGSGETAMATDAAGNLTSY
jgi:hypothetical protein